MINLPAISLGAPLFLLALPLPILVWLLAPPRPATGPMLVVPFALDGHRRALLILAICEPRRITHSDALPISGRDLIVALDLSGSMVREDFVLNAQTDSRLNVVKSVGSEFVRGRGGDRIALLVFGSKPYFATPFSYDVASVGTKIETATIGISGRATNISGAIGLALPVRRRKHRGQHLAPRGGAAGQ